MEQDWANLSYELTRRIFEKAPDIVQYMHMSAVCKAWRKALTSDPLPQLRQAPWLMIPRPAANYPSLSFYDLSESRIRRFELPPKHRAAYILGSSQGWLVLEHNNRIWLYNPVNGNAIYGLPYLRDPHNIPNRRSIWKVVLSGNPSNTDGCAIVAGSRVHNTWELGFCLIGDQQWTVLKRAYVGPSIVDFTLCNNSVYMVDADDNLVVYDLQNRDSRIFPFTFQNNDIPDQINLVEGSAGLLLVGSSCGLVTPIMPPIHLFGWNNSQQWQHVRTNQQIFLTKNQCCALQLEQHQGNILQYVAIRNVINISYRVGINRVNMRNENSVPDVILNPIQISNVVYERPSWFTPSLM